MHRPRSRCTVEAVAELTTDRRWKTFADVVAYALGTNVWISIVILPADFIGALHGAPRIAAATWSLPCSAPTKIAGKITIEIHTLVPSANATTSANVRHLRSLLTGRGVGSATDSNVQRRPRPRP